jgi:transcriptional regulator with XRE-family HTH domain
MQANNSKSLVAQFVGEQLGKSKRTVDEVAAQVGMSAKVLTMIASGKLKLAINQADALAKALGVDTTYVLRLVLEDSLPDAWSVIQDRLTELAITEFEQQIVDAYRRLSQGRDIAVFMFPAVGSVEVVPPKAAG